MRLQSRASACIAIVVALTTVFGLVAHRDHPTRRGRHGVFRIARVGAQRLDSAETASLDESPDPSLAPTAGVTPDRSRTSLLASAPAHGARSIDGASRPIRSDHAIVAPPGAIAGPPGNSILLPDLSDPSPPLARIRQPILGRAPPSA